MIDIENIIDASGKTPDYTIYLSKGANPKKMMEKLYLYLKKEKED